MTTTRGLAIGCGGTLGLAWSAVALAAVERALDWDVRTADVLLGTSAGAEAVAILGSGRTPTDLLDALDDAPGADPLLRDHVQTPPRGVPPLPRPALPAAGLVRAGLRERSAYTALAGLLPRGTGDAAWLHALGAGLAAPHGWVTHPRTWLVATDLTSGQRLALGSQDAPRVDLGTAIAASWAIPGWLPPVTVAGRRLVDGGTSSSVSADLLLPLGLDELVVVAPMTGAGGRPARGAARLERVLRRQMTRGLDREIAALEAAGTRVVRIEPTPADLDAMGPSLMDAHRRPATLATARRTLPATVAAALDHAGVCA